MDFLSSNSFMMLEKSMGFLWTKQASILDNIANAETPGYKPKVVTFEESLRGSLEPGFPPRPGPRSAGSRRRASSPWRTSWRAPGWTTTA